LHLSTYFVDDVLVFALDYLVVMGPAQSINS